jgi:hypothetical protein
MRRENGLTDSSRSGGIFQSVGWRLRGRRDSLIAVTGQKPNSVSNPVRLKTVFNLVDQKHCSLADRMPLNGQG